MRKIWLVVMGLGFGSLACAQAQLKPTYTISLSSALQCEEREHIAKYIRFAPRQDLLAVVLQAHSQRPSHVVLASHDGKMVRHLPYSTPDRRVTALFWSLDGSHIALETTKAVSLLRERTVSLIRVTDGKNCEIPSQAGSPIGFIAGQLFVFNNAQESGPTLDSYTLDCVMRESVRAPSGRQSLVTPGGGEFAFEIDDFEILLADVHGREIRKVSLDPPASKTKRKAIDLQGFAEAGNVLCFTVAERVSCFALPSSDSLPMPATNRVTKGPVHTAVMGTRVAWPTIEVRTIDTVLGLLSLPGALTGHGELREGQLLPPGWLVWDYQAKAILLKLASMFQRRSSSGPTIETQGALAPKGDLLAVAVQDSVLMFELPIH